MPLRIKCSSGHTLIVPDDRAGRRLRCPRCQAEVVVPGEPAAVAATAVVAASASETARSLSDEPSPGAANLATETPENGTPRSESPRETSRAVTRSVVKPKSRALPLPEPSSNSAEQPAATPPVAPPIAPPQIATPAAVPSPAVPPPVAPPAAAAPPQVKIAAPPIIAASPPAKALARDTAPRPSREPAPPSVRVEAQVAEPIQSAAPSVIAPPPPPAARPAPAVLLKVPEVSPTPTTVKADPTPEARIAAPPPEPSVSPPPPPTPPAPPLSTEALSTEALSTEALSTEAPSTPALTDLVPTISEPTNSVSATAVAEDEGLFDHLAALDFAPPTAAIRPVAAAANPEAARTLAVYQLAAALVAAALFSVAPAVWDLVEYLRIDGSPFVARWALLLFFIGVLQLAYAVYLFQLPDWSSVWVITVFALCGAALYAAVLGIVLMSAPDGVLVGPHGLQLADKLAGGKAALWCVAMVALLVMLALAAGKLCLSWQRAERMLNAVRGAG